MATERFQDNLQKDFGENPVFNNQSVISKRDSRGSSWILLNETCLKKDDTQKEVYKKVVIVPLFSDLSEGYIVRKTIYPSFPHETR